MRCLDPTRMSATDRLAELGELLAIGVQRLLARQCKPNKGRKISRERLDVTGANDASCGPFRMETTT